MFGIKKLKKEISDLKYKIIDINFRLYDLENPPKFKMGDKVHIRTVKMRGEKPDQTEYVIRDTGIEPYYSGNKRYYLIDSLLPKEKAFKWPESNLELINK